MFLAAPQPSADPLDLSLTTWTLDYLGKGICKIGVQAKPQSFDVAMGADPTKDSLMWLTTDHMGSLCLSSGSASSGKPQRDQRNLEWSFIVVGTGKVLLRKVMSADASEQFLGIDGMGQVGLVSGGEANRKAHVLKIEELGGD